jgi:hypothetical protein
VFLYDSEGTKEERAKPIHQFDFGSDAWQTHLVTGMLGPSYQLFIPYTRQNPYQAQCSLRVRFQPERGPATYSELVHVTLPGPVKPESVDSAIEAQPSQKTASSGSSLRDIALNKTASKEPKVGATLKNLRSSPLAEAAALRSPPSSTQCDSNFEIAKQGAGFAPGDRGAVLPASASRFAAGPATSRSLDAGAFGDARAEFHARLNELESKRAGTKAPAAGVAKQANPFEEIEEPARSQKFKLTAAEVASGDLNGFETDAQSHSEFAGSPAGANHPLAGW